MLSNDPSLHRYIVPGKTAFTKSWNSTHVRVLVFHSTAIKNAEILIDDHMLGEVKTVADKLLVCPWDPSLYISGVHRLTIHLRVGGRTYTHSIEFSLDGTRPPLSLRSVLLILTDFCTMLRILFIAVCVVTIGVPYVIKRYPHQYHIALTRRLLHQLFPQVGCWFLFVRVFSWSIESIKQNIFHPIFSVNRHPVKLAE